MKGLYVDGKAVQLDPKALLGQGGEAYIYDLGGERVCKVFRTPDDAMYLGDPAAQKAAAQRLELHQQKLRAFPANAPARMIGPQALATDRSGRILGYVMRRVAGEVLIRYSQPSYRRNVPEAMVLPILRDLWTTVGAVHKSGIVIGDFNDQNVVVSSDGSAHVIDADSAQWGSFKCSTYTTRFVDPLLCDLPAGASDPVLARPHTPESDWYAFNVIVAQTFLLVDPYGGVYQPPQGAPKVAHGARPMHRITIWNKHVRYPRPAIPFDVLPDDLLAHFHDCFERDRRGAFPGAVLERMRWTTCSGCGAEHARSQCPKTGCQTAAPAVVPVTTAVQVRGNVTATSVYRGRGVIVRAEKHGGALLWLAHEDGAYRREDGHVVCAAPTLDPAMRFRVTKDETYLALHGTMIRMAKDGAQSRYQVDNTGGAPLFQVTDAAVFWCDGGILLREEAGDLAPVTIGTVLAGQTRFWVGLGLGFGFYRAGAITVAFTFDPSGRGIRDTVPLNIRGKLLDATCVIDGSRAWFLTQTQEGARTVNRCALVRSNGSVEATAEAVDGDGSWLGSIRGGAAAGAMLLMATDTGIVRCEAKPGTGAIVPVREFPDTEPWVDSSCSLYACANGLYVLSGDRKKMTRLVIS